MRGGGCGVTACLTCQEFVAPGAIHHISVPTDTSARGTGQQHFWRDADHRGGLSPLVSSQAAFRCMAVALGVACVVLWKTSSATAHFPQRMKRSR